MKCVLASGNAGKLTEIRSVLTDLPITWISQAELGVADAEETASSFVENALLKARHAAWQTGLPALADDSGLCVDALGGAPGLHSARYAGVHGDSAANIARLLAELDGIDAARRSAHFFCTIVLLRHAADPAPLIVEGRWHGRILSAPRGDGGFGYDPIFLDPTRGLSAAELTADEKNRISHRGQALAQLRLRLPEWFSAASTR